MNSKYSYSRLDIKPALQIAVVLLMLCCLAVVVVFFLCGYNILAYQMNGVAWLLVYVPVIPLVIFILMGYVCKKNCDSSLSMIAYLALLIQAIVSTIYLILIVVSLLSTGCLSIPLCANNAGIYGIYIVLVLIIALLSWVVFGYSILVIRPRISVLCRERMCEKRTSGSTNIISGKLSQKRYSTDDMLA